MLDRKYSLAKPEDVRVLWRMNNSRVNLMLALLYAINETYSKVGYLIQSSKGIDLERQAYMAIAIGEGRARRLLLSAKLQQLLKSCDMTMTRQMGGRVKSVVARKTRGQPRPPGALADINQKGLFIFGDMFDDNNLMNVVINDIMFAEDT